MLKEHESYRITLKRYWNYVPKHISMNLKTYRILDIRDTHKPDHQKQFHKTINIISQMLECIKDSMQDKQNYFENKAENLM